MKKEIILGILLFVLLTQFNLVFVEAAESGLNKGALESDAEKIRDATGQLKELTEKDKWEYLAEKWKELLMKNDVFVAINGFFEKISIVFFIFLGIGYEFSPLFFMTIIIWSFHLWLFSVVFGYSPLGKSTKLLVALGMVIVLSQLKYINLISELALKIMLWKEGIWRFVSILIFVFAFIFLFVFIKLLKKQADLTREKRAKEKEEQDRKTLHQMAEGVRGGVE